MFRMARLSSRVPCLVVVVAAIVAPSLVVSQETLIATGDAWRYFKGTEDPPANWNTGAFDDSEWAEGATPIGYSADLPYATVLADMQNAYFSVYMRKTFSVANPASIRLVKLRIRYDDGFIAYLNGVEIARRSIAGTVGVPVPFNTGATDHETNVAYEEIALPCDSTGIEQGDNVLAIQGHNSSLASSDFSLDPELQAIDVVCPNTFTCEERSDKTSVLLKWKRPAGVIFDSIVLLRNNQEVTPVPSKSAVSYVDRAPVTGRNDYTLIATVCESECTGADVLTCSVMVQGAEAIFRRGDSDSNGTMNLTDSIYILQHLFQGGPGPTCPDAADVDDNGSVNLTDSIYILQALFQGGPQPVAPGASACGPDPGADTLATCVYPGC